MKKLTEQIKEILKEIRSITWPSRQRVINDTLIVTVSLIAGATVIAFIDKGLFAGFKSVVEQFQK